MQLNIGLRMPYFSGKEGDAAFLLNGQTGILAHSQKVAKMGHLTEGQRCAIESMLQAGYQQNHIAKAIGLDKSVASRERKRNGDLRNGEYRSGLAQSKYLKRQKDKPKKVCFDDKAQQYVNEKRKDKYSPEQMVGTAVREGVAMASYDRIYPYIWADKKSGGKLHAYLRAREEIPKKGGHER